MLVINDKSLLNYFFRISIRYHDPILFNRILQEDDWIRLKMGKEGDGVKAKIKILYCLKIITNKLSITTTIKVFEHTCPAEIALIL